MEIDRRRWNAMEYTIYALMHANESIFTCIKKARAREEVSINTPTRTIANSIGSGGREKCDRHNNRLKYHLRQFNNHAATAIVTRITFAIHFIAIEKLYNFLPPESLHKIIVNFLLLSLSLSFKCVCVCSCIPFITRWFMLVFFLILSVCISKFEIRLVSFISNDCY